MSKAFRTGEIIYLPYYHMIGMILWIAKGTAGIGYLNDDGSITADDTAAGGDTVAIRYIQKDEIANYLYG